MSESSPSKIVTLAKLAASLVVAGLLVAALFLPFVGGTGVVVRNSADIVNKIPDELTDKMPAGNTIVKAADGSVITEFYENNRTLVTSDQIAPVMKQAQVDIEDSRFYEHNGVDVEGTARALAKNLAAGGVQEGGSTITQQLVKQTLLQSADDAEGRLAATDDTVGRKLREARYALALEKKYSKDEILTRYLNMAYFGGGAYGVEAAAQKYFSVRAADLSLPQAAMLAGLVQSPTNDNPLEHPEAAQTRRNQVLNRMHTLGHGGGANGDEPMSDEQLAELKAQPVETAAGGNPPNGCANASVGGFFCDYLYGYLQNTLKLSTKDIANGGYVIQTTLRPDMQTAGDQAVLNTVGLDNPLIGAYDVVEPGTGHVLAMSVNRRYGCDDPNAGCESVNFAVTPSKGSGSTFKMFVAAAALESGKTANFTLTTPDRYVSRIYKTYDKGRRVPYGVSNVGTSYPNTLTMEQALYMSSNTYFLALEDELGSVRPAVEMAQRLGMSFDAPNQKSADYWIDGNLGSFPYSPEPVSPLDLASAYSTIAASGVKCAPTPVVSITTPDGKPLTRDDGQPVVKGDDCQQVIEPGIANTLNQMMRKDVEPSYPLQTAERAFIPGHQIAGKTGTVNNNDSVTFVGSTPEYTGTVMVFRPLGTDSVGGFGGNKPATIWHDAMLPILSAQQTAEFPPADPKWVGSRPAPPSSSDGDRSRGGNGGGGNNGGGNNGGGTNGGGDNPPAQGTTEAPAPDTGGQANPPADPNAGQNQGNP
ncbi:transglycosylase domain-containing protein [Modestobacter sp. NPDC049651]|uniref:transglycosylase domain-containing protein n=1 Tax=unclassified Modestobacter TaxID=2643866 RepID=UPI0033E5EB23